MLATMAGLAARGTATISRARQLRWRKEWLRKPCSEKPELAFTIERCREGEDGGEVERKLLTALQEAEERLQPPLVGQDQPDARHRFCSSGVQVQNAAQRNGCRYHRCV